jgi:hypothetical protein
MTSPVSSFACFLAALSIAVVATPSIVSAEEGDTAAQTKVTATPDAAVPARETVKHEWSSLPKKERVAREWRSLPKGERVAREKNGRRPEILD